MQNKEANQMTGKIKKISVKRKNVQNAETSKKKAELKRKIENTKNKVQELHDEYFRLYRMYDSERTKVRNEAYNKWIPMGSDYALNEANRAEDRDGLIKELDNDMDDVRRKKEELIESIKKYEDELEDIEEYMRDPIAYEKKRQDDERRQLEIKREMDEEVCKMKEKLHKLVDEQPKLKESQQKLEEKKHKLEEEKYKLEEEKSRLGRKHEAITENLKWINNDLCSYCGGKFNFWGKNCKICGKKRSAKEVAQKNYKKN